MPFSPFSLLSLLLSYPYSPITFSYPSPSQPLLSLLSRTLLTSLPNLLLSFLCSSSALPLPSSSLILTLSFLHLSFTLSFLHLFTVTRTLSRPGFDLKWTLPSTYTEVSRNTHTNTQSHTHAYTYTHTDKYTYTYTYIDTYIDTDTSNIYIHTHTYVRVCKLLLT